MSTSNNPIPATAVSQPKPAQSGIPQVVQVMQSVKTNTPEAKLNTHSISDNNDGRIELNDQTVGSHQGQSSTIVGNLGNQKF